MRITRGMGVELERLIEEEFPQDPGLLYLNHAGVAPWPRRTVEAVRNFAAENLHRGAKNYGTWVAHEAQLREQLRQFINAASADEISLLKNTSEALSVVACGIGWQPGDNVVSTDQEFPSNRIPWQAQRVHGVDFREVNISGPDDPEGALMACCDERTRVLTVSSVQYGSGFRLDLERLGRFCRDNGILYCIDAIQSLGAHRFDVQANRADFIMADGHKWLLAPEGLALFYCRDALRDRLRLHHYGWHMVEDHQNYEARAWQPAAHARRFECGSPNMLGIHALSASLSLLVEIGMETVERNVLNITGYLIDIIKDNNRFSLLTPVPESRRAGIVTCKIRDRDPAYIHRKLLENNVICANRCGAIRFSPHFYTPRSVIDKVFQILISVI